ncbi:uncharacterized protein MYCFIDRAFT_79594, partial [Pseudocercospora fijiensis CIRAD86]
AVAHALQPSSYSVVAKSSNAADTPALQHPTVLKPLPKATPQPPSQAQSPLQNPPVPLHYTSQSHSHSHLPHLSPPFPLHLTANPPSKPSPLFFTTGISHA